MNEFKRSCSRTKWCFYVRILFHLLSTCIVFQSHVVLFTYKCICNTQFKMLCVYLLTRILHLTLNTTNSDIYSRLYEKLPDVIVHAFLNITEQNSPQTCFVSMQNVVTVRYLKYNWYFQWPRWPRCARGPGFHFWLWQRFYV